MLLKLSNRTIWGIINKHSPGIKKETLEISPVQHLDATHFGRDYGLMLSLGSNGIPSYFHLFEGYETKLDYHAAIHSMNVNLKLNVKAVVIDIMPGLKNTLEALGLAVQYCQFHQVAIVRRYLTNNPRLEPNKQLKTITLNLKSSTKKEFKYLLDQWYLTNREWLNERELSLNSNRLRYTHQRTRSAYHSLVRNLDNLFAFEEHPDLNIPRTNNRIEGYFSNLKGAPKQP